MFYVHWEINIHECRWLTGGDGENSAKGRPNRPSTSSSKSTARFPSCPRTDGVLPCHPRPRWGSADGTVENTAHIVRSQGSHANLSPSAGRGRSRNLGLSHHDISCLTYCLLFLHILHLLFFASPICCHFSPGPRTMNHAVCHHCHVHCSAHGSLSCYFRLCALPHIFGGFIPLQRTCCWKQFDSPCSEGISLACGRRVIPALLYTPLHCICSRFAREGLSSSCIWARCGTWLRCGLIHSRAHTCSQGRRLWTPQLGTALPPPWCPSWLTSVPPCFPLLQKQPMMGRFLHSASSPRCCGGSPAIILGWGLLCPYSPPQIRLASSAGLLCLFPCTVREILHGSLAFPKTDFLRHQRLLCGNSSLLRWWGCGIAEPSPLLHSGMWLPWSRPSHSSLRLWS